MRQPGTHNRGRHCCRRAIDGKTRPTRLLLVTVAMVFVACGSASAQVGTTSPAPVGATSPLGIGSAPALPQTGTSLGPAGVGSAAIDLADRGHIAARLRSNQQHRAVLRAAL